jgi:small subunit ribosomal protein SAe
MSNVPLSLNLTEADAKLMLACGVHIGDQNLNPAMQRYVHKRNDKGFHIIDIRKTWEKLVLAARVIVTIENTKDLCVVAVSPAQSTSYAQRAVLKFANYVGARPIAGRITPGTFTNQQQSQYLEPRLLIASDPRFDHQPIVEASYVNLPVICFANVHHRLYGIDIAIPCNTQSKNSIACMYWLLAREVLRLKGMLARDKEWDVLVDMFIYRDPEESAQQTEEATWQAPGWSSSAPDTQWGDHEGEAGGEDYAQTGGEPFAEGFGEEGAPEWGGAEW